MGRMPPAMVDELYRALRAAGVDDLLAREAADSVVQRERTPEERVATMEMRRVKAEADARRYTRWIWVMIIVGAIVNALILAW